MATRTVIGASVAGAAVVAGVAVGVARAVRSDGPDGPGSDRDPGGWKSVTVLAEPEALRPDGAYPEPLEALAARLEIVLKPASRERGTELHARFRPGEDADPQALRAALRDAKALIETGIVQHADPVPHGRRKPTPFGLAQDEVESHAKGSGLL